MAESPMKHHPLGIAARYMDADCEEHGFHGAIQRQSLELDDIMYLAQQRALRCALVYLGRAQELPAIAGKPLQISLTAKEMQFVEIATLSSLDSLLIGWRARGMQV